MTRQLQRFLGSGDALARLRDHAGRLMRLQTLLARQLPPAMATSCSVANLKGDSLVLLADGGAAAARLRQMAPSLVQQLAAAGIPVKTIQVKVKVTEVRDAERPVTRRTLSAAGSRSLEELAAALPDDSPLRESLERLLRRSNRN